MNKPVVTEIAEREQPEHPDEYFREQLKAHRLESQKPPLANSSVCHKPEQGGR